LNEEQHGEDKVMVAGDQTNVKSSRRSLRTTRAGLDGMRKVTRIGKSKDEGEARLASGETRRYSDREGAD
jgi:hypothetical protein